LLVFVMPANDSVQEPALQRLRLLLWRRL
jgi:hypothetical protein